MGASGMHVEFLREAIRLADESLANGGGPFGAVIVRDGAIVGRGNNRVTLNNDPTAHAEVQAIRDACRSLGDFQLSGCELYVSCEPCPMCMAAAYWARLDGIYFAASAEDAAQVGFDDVSIRDELRREPAQRHLPMAQALRQEGQVPFARWEALADRVEY
ncbi:MAG: nucleoside deaminase [Pseudomonadota bacterium]